MKLQTPKGFRDFLPAQSLKRQFVMQKITKVFEKFGFDPLETPTLEYAETLKGKYGEEEKLIYEFETKGGDMVALKYDSTVPLARVVAQYGPNGMQELPIPFKRYQIQSNFRGENPQKGRYREFTQCDADVIGVSSPLTDAEILGLLYAIYKELGLDVIIKVNDRALFNDIEPKYLSAIDKLSKIGDEGVMTELKEKGLSDDEASNLLNKFKTMEMSENLKQIIDIYEIYQAKYEMKGEIQFDPTLVRGLDYYTGLIFEVVMRSNPNSSSLCGGGRWDKMIGKFTGSDLPAIGFAIGVDRTIEAMEEAGVINIEPTGTKVLVTIFSKELADISLAICSKFREAGINTEVWLDFDPQKEIKLDKQLKYADRKGIPFAYIIGPEEYKNKSGVLKNLKQRTQETLSDEEAIQKLLQ